MYSHLGKQLRFSYKAKCIHNIQPRNPRPGYLSQSNENYVHTKSCQWKIITALFVIAPNCPNVIQQVNGSTNSDTLTLWILLRNKTEWAIVTHNLERSQGHYDKWKGIQSQKVTYYMVLVTQHSQDGKGWWGREWLSNDSMRKSFCICILIVVVVMCKKKLHRTTHAHAHTHECMWKWVKADSGL